MQRQSGTLTKDDVAQAAVPDTALNVDQRRFGERTTRSFERLMGTDDLADKELWPPRWNRPLGNVLCCVTSCLAWARW